MRASSRRPCGRPPRMAGSPRSPSGTSGLRSRWRRPRPDIDYEIVALDGTIVADPERIQRLLAEVSDGLANGELAPLPVEIYPLTEAKTAFRRMQQARHIGKIVLQMPKPLQPRGDRSYLITGGLGALGLHTAAHLAQLGAGDIVLTSRRAARCGRTTGDRRHHGALPVPDPHLRGRRRRRVPGRRAAGDGSGRSCRRSRGWRTWRACSTTRCCRSRAVERFRTTLAPKAFGACHLHRLTKDDDLEFFIVYSSVSSVLGSPGQANYATANALLDGLVAERKAQGLPATSVNWGPWAKGGMASFARRARQSRCARPDSAGTHGRPQRARRDRRPRNRAGNRHQSQLAACREGAGRFSPTDSRPRAAECCRGDTRRQRVAPATARGTRGAARPVSSPNILQREVQQFLRLAQPPAATSRFLDLGTDSLMAVELRNRLLGQFGGAFTISATAVFDYPTIGSLAEYLAGQMPEGLSRHRSGDAESVGAPEPT